LKRSWTASAAREPTSKRPRTHCFAYSSHPSEGGSSRPGRLEGLSLETAQLDRRSQVAPGHCHPAKDDRISAVITRCICLGSAAAHCGQRHLPGLSSCWLGSAAA